MSTVPDWREGRKMIRAGADAGSRTFKVAAALRKHRWTYVLLIPVIAYFFVFHYMPLYGIQLAFKDFMIRKGISGSPWVGLKHFEVLLNSPIFQRALVNTLLISCYKLLFAFPAGVLFALMLNDLNNGWFKSFSQTFSYLPHFLSWVILGGILSQVLSLDGAINAIRAFLGMEEVFFLTEPGMFRGIVVASDIWKEVGWNSIIYLAAISGVGPELYEAARVDGAKKLQQVLRITLPMILPVISIQFILQLGNILNAGFDQIFNLYNPTVYSTGDIIDTYVYRIGLTDKLQYSLSTAVGLFKNVIGCSLVILANAAVRGIGGGENSIW